MLGQDGTVSHPAPLYFTKRHQVGPPENEENLLLDITTNLLVSANEGIKLVK